MSDTSTGNNNSNSLETSNDHGKNNTSVDSLNKQEKKFGNMLKKKELIAKNMGTTANIIYINDKKIYVANVGDSFSVMYKNKEAIKLNEEHKLTLKNEQQRVINSGCKIINNRIEGKLNLSRAIGNLIFYKIL